MQSKNKLVVSIAYRVLREENQNSGVETNDILYHNRTGVSLAY